MATHGQFRAPLLVHSVLFSKRKVLGIEPKIKILKYEFNCRCKWMHMNGRRVKINTFSWLFCNRKERKKNQKIILSLCGALTWVDFSIATTKYARINCQFIMHDVIQLQMNDKDKHLVFVFCLALTFETKSWNYFNIFFSSFCYEIILFCMKATPIWKFFFSFVENFSTELCVILSFVENVIVVFFCIPWLNRLHSHRFLKLIFSCSFFILSFVVFVAFLCHSCLIWVVLLFACEDIKMHIWFVHFRARTYTFLFAALSFLLFENKKIGSSSVHRRHKNWNVNLQWVRSKMFIFFSLSAGALKNLMPTKKTGTKKT